MAIILALLSGGFFSIAESRRRSLKKKGRGRSGGGGNLISTFADVMAVLCVLASFSWLVVDIAT